MIRVEQPGLMTTIQDLGRVGHRAAGISQTGVLDPHAASIANWLVGNDEEAALLEITIIGPVLVFESPLVISLCGGDLQPCLNGNPVKNWVALSVQAGDVLSFKGLLTGARAYLAVQGGFQTEVVLGSRSTHMKAGMGGVEGRALKKGDHLPVMPLTANNERWAGNRLALEALPVYNQSVELRLVLGPHEDRFSEEAIQTLTHSAFEVTTLCDRMGFRLQGPALAHQMSADILSEPNQIGSIQVPGDGQPIILLNDAGTTGGYTKIATVLQCDLHQIAQLKAGDAIRFVPVSLKTARALSQSYFEDLRSLKQSLLACQKPVERHFNVNINGKCFEVLVEEVEG